MGNEACDAPIRERSSSTAERCEGSGPNTKDIGYLKDKFLIIFGFPQRRGDLKDSNNGEGEHMEMQQPVNDRVNELEKKVREMEALIKGLTNELLDLKSIVERMSSRMEEKRPVVTRPQGRVAVSPKGQPGEGADEGELARIMQPDGTMKEERRKDSDYIIASAKTAQALRNKGKGEQSKGKGSSALIYAVEEEDSASKK